MVSTLTRLLKQLHRHAAPPGPDGDAALLARYARQRDEAAFAALMARHGPLVWGVCQRVLGDRQAAEDAFQATFLVFARKAGSVGRPAALAGWLYGVAYRVALRARRASRRWPQNLTEAPEPPDSRPDPLAEVTARDLLAVLEQEVQRLPEAYRLPVVLCCLEGLSQEEAASRLGWTPGSVKGRLERGRKRLFAALSRRGLMPTAALAAAEAARAGAAPTGTASVRAILLAEGVMRMMQLKRLGIAALCLAGLVGAAVAVLAQAPTAPRPVEAARAAAPAPKQDRRLWAALGVNQPIFHQGGTELLQINFTLVNDGDKIIDPTITASKIVVNDKPLADSAFIFGNGPRDQRFEALPPGDHLLFGAGLGKYFDKPGVYRVRWEGEGFRSAELVFRVLPKAPPPPAIQDRPKEGPAPLQPPDPKPEAPRDDRVRKALDEVLARARDDRHLRPRAGEAVRVEGTGPEVSLRYPTTDWWPDLPSKKPAGPQPGNGSVSVQFVQGELPRLAVTPFLPPKGCHVAHSVYGTDVPELKLMVWSMTRERAAHDRLVALLRSRLAAAGITMSAEPLTPPSRMGGGPDDGPPDDKPANPAPRP